MWCFLGPFMDFKLPTVGIQLKKNFREFWGEGLTILTILLINSF